MPVTGLQWENRGGVKLRSLARVEEARGLPSLGQTHLHSVPDRSE